MRPKSILITPVASDDDGVCAAQAVAAAGYLTIAGDLASDGVATFTQPAHVLITCAGADALVTFTITGTNRYGVAMTEDIAGSNGSTTAGTLNFATITYVYSDAACAGNVEVGNANSLESQWIQMNRYGGDISIGVTCSSDVNYTYAIQHTFTDIQTTGFQEGDATAHVHATITGETTSQNGSYSTPVNAIRLAITSFVAGTATIEIIQADV